MWDSNSSISQLSISVSILYSDHTDGYFFYRHKSHQELTSQGTARAGFALAPVGFCSRSTGNLFYQKPLAERFCF